MRFATATSSVALLGLAGPALAQVGGSLSIESDQRLRGFTLSAGRPVATAQVSYDDLSGIYASASGTIAVHPDDVRFLGVRGNIGYAQRVSSAVSIDMGLTRTQYRAPEPGGRNYRYTEVYFGVVRDPFLARVSYSPDYFRNGAHTLYGELEGTVRVADGLSVNGHAGALVFVATPQDSRPPHSTYYDWRIGARQQVGSVEVHAAISGGGPGKQRYRQDLHSRTRFTLGASWNF